MKWIPGLKTRKVGKHYSNATAKKLSVHLSSHIFTTDLVVFRILQAAKQLQF